MSRPSISEDFNAYYFLRQIFQYKFLSDTQVKVVLLYSVASCHLLYEAYNRMQASEKYYSWSANPPVGAIY